MTISMTVDNIKCGGCANTIKNTLLKDSRISGVEVDVTEGVVTLTSEADVRAEVVHTLATLGYPERNTATGASAVKAKAKSFVSCAVGRITS